MKILLDFQNGMRAVTLNSEFSLCGLSKNPYPKERAVRKLILPAQLLVLQLVMDQPAHYLDEIQRVKISPAH